ncbi:MAG: hypothetical protein IT354_13365 [Gemmatimonadaceae bacterium]|jgi:hypothetical protein|nr:hypothetical protein [Gemmatimonadaceae bacterium]
MLKHRLFGGRLARLAVHYGVAAAVAGTTLTLPTPLAAQWVTTYEQFYLQAPHNWTFRNNYQAADRLFNAFDYGHAILYEKLWTMPNASPAELEVKEYEYLTKRVLVRPPRVPLEEAAIEIKYVQLAPEAKQISSGRTSSIVSFTTCSLTSVLIRRRRIVKCSG